MSSSFLVLGQSFDLADPKRARIEVALAQSRATKGADPVIYVTGYRRGQIGERSVGMSAQAAREVAALLLVAAARATP